ncbi:glycine betaine/proline transport system ATP-binding protein [Desulfonispora thiosulfatigenes DSM 11270]|uniref:Quaternary amine transport ATP-binding protein n=1 Tax=Desulfonispora thiosulfatigenes DSM 11270 TaxID=656914 RepID=A0A1W1V2W8_DESTI|nr:glycine betaine/L-proline ABC transporter ATP-binding protein [Desulfonispora thiosulfatigenes]SMB87630.1 glycine betaine/proline transport system ATP-binding protein [Desulfonispora thiosulfatigenes DSM 11270]
MIQIKVENLYKVFGSNPQRAIKLIEEGMDKDEILNKTGLAVGVGGVSFEVNKGEILVIMGLSGSGKSTLIRCLNRLIEPTAGKIYVDDKEILGLDRNQLRDLRRKKFAMVFQKFALFPHRTILQNAEYGLEVQGIDANTRKEKARNALELVGLGGWEDRYPNELSGGMQQRVGLARGLAVDPDILLMDEAFSALDPLIKREMQDELISLQSKVQKTIVFITHDLDEAIKLGDRIILMKDGVVVQEGTPEDILTNPADDYVEKFVENVDRSKILTAQGVMNKVGVVAYSKDGPRTAMRKMKEEGISSIFVVNSEYKVQGVVLAEQVAQAIKNGDKDLANVIEKNIAKVSPDLSVNELFPMMTDIRYPLAVVDETEKLLGVVIRGSILAGLAGRGDE